MIKRRLHLTILILLALLLVPVQPVFAATFYVESTADTGGSPATCNDGDGCTLRQAINLANANGVADVIILDTELAGQTITMTIPLDATPNDNNEGEYDITTEISIRNNSGGTVTIDANDIDRVFHVLAAGIFTLGDAADDPIILTGGSTNNGAGIYNAGTINTIANVTISGNSADGLGGGIANFGAISAITNSIISGNSADDGGGIFASGTISAITNSTIPGSGLGLSIVQAIADYYGGSLRIESDGPGAGTQAALTLPVS